MRPVTNITRLVRHLGLGLAVLVGVWSLFVPSADAQNQPVALQLKPLAMPAITDKGYKGRMTMTPYMEVVDAAAVERLCERLPRLMDAVILAFEDQPVLLADPEGDMRGRQEKLRELTDQSIGTGVFKAFYLVTGSVKRGEGTEMIEVSGGKRECQPIRELPWIVAGTDAAVPADGAGVAGAAGAEGATPMPMQAGQPEAIAPSPLSEAELLRAEAELMAEQPIRKPFPGEPMKEKPIATSTVMVAIILIGIGGVMMVIGSYIGYQVAKIRRERRRKERRQARKDRRGGAERRKRDDGPPPSGERRSGDERRRVKDRRVASDRRSQKDRRFEPGQES